MQSHAGMATQTRGPPSYTFGWLVGWLVGRGNSRAAGLLKRRWLPRKIGAESLPRLTRGRYLPLKRDTSRPISSLLVWKLHFLSYRTIADGRRNRYTPVGEQIITPYFSRSVAPEGNCHKNEVGLKAHKDAGGLSIALLTPNQDGPVCLLLWRASRPNGGWPECQAHGLQFSATHSKGQASAWLRQYKLLLDLGGWHAHHYPIQPFCYVGPSDANLSDSVLSTQLESLPSTDDTRCRSTFWTYPTTPKRQESVQSKLLDEVTIDACVKELSSAILGTTATPASKSHLRAHLRPPLPACIHD